VAAPESLLSCSRRGSTAFCCLSPKGQQAETLRFEPLESLTFSNLLAFLSVARTRASSDRCLRPVTTSRLAGAGACRQDRTCRQVGGERCCWLSYMQHLQDGAAEVLLVAEPAGKELLCGWLCGWELLYAFLCV
jgi:hypothetical protein